MERIVPSSINISISVVENSASLGETAMSMTNNMIRKLDENGEPMRDEDGQTILTADPNEEFAGVNFTGVIEFPPYLAIQRKDFNNINILSVEGEEAIQTKMSEREPTLAMDIGQELFVNDSNRQEYEAMGEEERILFFMQKCDDLLQMNANVQLADSISFYKISEDPKINIHVDSIFNVNIAKPLFLAAILCYDSGYSYFDGVKILSDIELQSPTPMQKFNDNSFSVKFSRSDEEIESSEEANASLPLIHSSDVEPGDMPNKVIFVVFKAEYTEDELQIDQIGFTILPLRY